MKENSNFFERIKSIMSFYDINSVNELAINHLGYRSSEKINRLKKEGTAPSYEILNDISNKFEMIDVRWLLTGNGNMLIKDTTQTRRYEEQKHIVSEPNTSYGNAISLYDISAAAGFGNFNEMISNEKVVGTYVIPNFKNADWMIYVRGSSMYPKYSSGDIIACRVLHESQFIQWNKVYVVATREQGILVKRINESDKEGCLLAISENPAYKPFYIPKDEILGIALVVGVIRFE